MINRTRFVSNVINWGYYKIKWEDTNGKPGVNLPKLYHLNKGTLLPKDFELYEDLYKTLVSCKYLKGGDIPKIDYDKQVANKTFDQLDSEAVKWVTGYLMLMDGNDLIIDQWINVLDKTL